MPQFTRAADEAQEKKPFLATIEGGATLGWELIDQLPDHASALDRLVVHVGGGAFASAQALAQSLAQSGYGRANPGRHYAYLRISAKDPFDWLYVSPARVLGAGGKAPANSRINVALIGIGRQAFYANLPPFLAHPDTQVVEVSPNDGGQHCCCPACKAIDDANGSPSGSLLDFVNHIAAAVEKVRPDLLVSTLAYLDTVDPPKLVRPRPNVVVRLCNDLHSWRYPFMSMRRSRA